jgi:hypothetical protein
LWVSDGTETGTTLLKDIYPGATGALLPAVPVAKKGNLLYFTADDGATGAELWQTGWYGGRDNARKGHSAGTREFAAANLALLDGQLYFSLLRRNTGWNFGKATARTPARCWWPTSTRAPVTPTRRAW